MGRLPDATVRLAELISAAQQRRFRWGRWDCCQFAARAVHALTGRDPREIFPAYRTRAEAERVIDRCGGLEALAEEALKKLDTPKVQVRDITLSDGTKLFPKEARDELNAWLADRFGHRAGNSIHPSLATAGDIVLCDFGRGVQPAVCVGVYCLAPGRRGLERRMTLNSVAAWKI
jgi:hypothetical protein